MDYEELINYAGFDCIPQIFCKHYRIYRVKMAYVEYID
jgi:hypothetical protein